MVYRILLLSTLFAAGKAHAEFARWTSKDGKVAELELQKLEKKGDEEMVTFRTRAGKIVTMKLTDLQEADWERARAAMSGAAADPAPAAPTTVAGGKLELSFEGAAVHAKQEVEGGAPVPGKLEYRFTVRGATYAGVKPETLEVGPFKIGNRIVPTNSWSIVSNGGGQGVPLVLTSQGNFDPTKLSGSKLTATVTAMVGNVLKTERLNLKVPKDESKTVTGKAGPFEVYLTRDVKKVSLGINSKIPQQLVGYRIEDGSPEGSFSIDLLKVGYTVPIVVSYWEKVEAVPLKIEATAP